MAGEIAFTLFFLLVALTFIWFGCTVEEPEQ